MAENLLAPDTDTSSEPQDLLASDTQGSGPKLSEPPVPTATTYIPEKGLSVDHPADMSHDQVNDAIQTHVFERPRNFYFNLDPVMAVAEHVGVEAGSEPKLIPETAKAAVRMAESVPKGVAALMGVMGDAGVEGIRDKLGFDSKVSQGFADMGNNAFEFYKDRGERGWEAPDPEVFRGAFMSNPSFTRLASDIVQNVPLVAATAVASASTGGAAPLALFSAMAAGEAGKAAEANGEGVRQALAVGAGAGIGNAVLMSLPLGKWIAKLGVAEPAASSASFAALGSMMVPFNNIVAKLGGDRARKLFDGFAESLISMAASGFVLGSFMKGGAAQHDEDVSAASKAGVTPGEIDSARKFITKQIVENSSAVNAALLEKMVEVKLDVDASAFNFGENDKKNSQLSTEEEQTGRDIEEAQKTISEYEARKEFSDQVGKFRRPSDGFLRSELSLVSSKFFTNNPHAESIDEVAERMDLTTNELVDRLQDASRGARADKAAYKDAQAFLKAADVKMLELAKEAARVRAEAGREFVKNEPFNFQLGKNDKITAENIRNEKTGIEREQVARGNQLADRLRRMVPDKTEREGLFWYKAAEGDRAFLEEARDSEEMVPYKDQLEKALNLSPEAMKALDLIDKYYKESGEVAKEIGTVRELRDNYMNRLYKPEPPKDFVSSEGTQGLKQSTFHGQRRVYETEFEAIQNGKEFATTDIADSLAIHNEEMARVNTAKKLANSLVENGIAAWKRPSNIPADWEQVGTLKREVPIQDKNGEAVLGEDGNQLYSSSVLVAPKGIAKGLEAVTDPNFVNKIEALRGLQKYQGIVKMADVALGYFHDWNVIKQNMYSRGFQDLMDLNKLDAKLSEPDFEAREKYAVRHTLTTNESQQNIDILKSLVESDPGLLHDIEKAPGVKQILEVPEKHANFLFNKMLRYLKVQHFTALASDWMAKNPEATNEQIKQANIGFAKHINATYGGLNWESLGISKTHIGLLRLGLFAPDWTLSKIELVKQAVGGGTAGPASRGYLLRSTAIGMVLTEGLNKILTGHFTDKNERGHFLEVEIAPGVHVSMLPGVVEDISKLGSRIVSGGLSGVGAFAQGKLSPALRLGAGLIARVKYSGEPIVDRKHLGNPYSSTADYLKFILQSVAPVPFAVSSLSDYLSNADNKSIPGAVAIAAGISRFSKQHKTKGQSFA